MERGDLLRNVENAAAIVAATPSRRSGVKAVAPGIMIPAFCECAHPTLSSKHIIRRPVSDLRQVFLAPSDHLSQAFIPPDLRFPSYCVLNPGRIEPVAGVLTKPILA